MKIRCLSKEDLHKALSMQEAIALMKEAFRAFSTENVLQPQRIDMEIPQQNAGILVMPVYAARYQQVGLKLASVFRNNPAQKLPLIQGFMMLVDAQNGQPLALMDAGALTPLRTAAASGLATDLLARKNAHTLAIFGTGANALTHLEAMCCVRNVQKAYIFGRNLHKAQAFVEKIKMNHPIELIASNRQEDLQAVDLICTSTSAENPVFDPQYLQAGTHINAIGSYKPHCREIPEETVLQSKIVVDSLEACLAEAGDLLIPMQAGKLQKEAICATLGELISQKKASRTNKQEITLFKSVGMAIQDLAVAQQAVKKAEMLGLGTVVKM